MIVRDAMLSDPRVLEADAAVQEAAEVLSKPNVRSVLVVDGGRLAGCVTKDAIVAAVARGEDLTSRPVRDLCERDVATIGPDAPLEEALRLMAERGLERLAVTRDRRLLGVLPRAPILRRLAEDEPPEPELPEDRFPAA